MTLLVEKQDITRVYDKQTEAWKIVKRDQNYDKQLSTIEDMLAKFGLQKNEIKVYLKLARTGEMKAGEISEAISLHRTETYKILRDLEKKGIVYAIFEKPLKFTAVPLDKAVDLLVDTQKIQIKMLEQEKPSLVELWHTLPKQEITQTKKEMFQILEGEEQILTKANELLAKTASEFKVFASSNYLSQLYYSDFIDNLKEKNDNITATLFTDNSSKSSYFINQLRWLDNANQIKDDQNLPCLMISDNKEILIIFHDEASANNDENKRKYRTAAVWTNYNAIVKIVQMLFLKILQI